jgi:PAS domain S-box-containing protein
LTNEDPIKILCVDDQVANLISLEAALEGPGYQIIPVQSGKEALFAVEHADFAVVLLDVQMPTLDGFQTAKLIRENVRSESTPIIFLTAHSPSDSYALQGYKAGAVDYLFKPLNIDVLRAKVGVFVDLFKKNLEIRRQAELLRKIERREQERELAKVKRISERKYQNLVEGIREGIVWSANPRTFQFSFVSRHAENITGYPLAEWLSEPEFLKKCLPDEERDRVIQALRSSLSNGTRPWIEHQFVTSTGKRIWLHTDVHMYREDENSRAELHGLSVDITHLKETEQALRESIRIRDEAIRLREEFLSIASHELKTPITPLQLQMQSFIRMLESGKMATIPADRLKEMLVISDAQVTRLSRLIGQLLDVSRLREGHLKLEVQTVNLSELVRGVLNQLHHEIEASECPVSLNFEEEIHGTWDRLRIEQVLINLLTNSMKYGEGKPIRISVRRRANTAVLEVKDQGIGIACADQERIFGRFERAVPHKNYGGLGLGLYISREIVQMHDGAIRVESEAGQGATFSVELPIGNNNAKSHN